VAITETSIWERKEGNRRVLTASIKEGRVVIKPELSPRKEACTRVAE
jgi:hypothetical protein